MGSRERMDSSPSFDDDDFFGSYDAEQVHAGMSTPLEFDDDGNSRPTREQLAHWGRFRKPVGLVVAAMGVLSLVALSKRGTHEDVPERPLVANYGASLPAPAKAPASEIAEPGLQDAPSSVPGADSDLIPEGLSSLAGEIWSVFAPEPPASTTVPLVITDSEAMPQPPAPEPKHEAPTTGSAPQLPRAFVPPSSPMCRLPQAGTDDAP